jgi:hypothetical protein
MAYGTPRPPIYLRYANFFVSQKKKILNSNNINLKLNFFTKSTQIFHKYLQKYKSSIHLRSSSTTAPAKYNRSIDIILCRSLYTQIHLAQQHQLNKLLPITLASSAPSRF